MPAGDGRQALGEIGIVLGGPHEGGTDAVLPVVEREGPTRGLHPNALAKRLGSGRRSARAPGQQISDDGRRKARGGGRSGDGSGRGEPLTGEHRAGRTGRVLAGDHLDVPERGHAPRGDVVDFVRLPECAPLVLAAHEGRIHLRIRVQEIPYHPVGRLGRGHDEGALGRERPVTYLDRTCGGVHLDPVQHEVLSQPLRHARVVLRGQDVLGRALTPQLDGLPAGRPGSP